MSVKPRADLIAEIVAQVKANGAQAINGPIVQALLNDLADSSVNMLGDSSIVGKLGYSTLLAISSDGDIPHKKYVDDAISTATPAGVILADGTVPMTADLNIGANNIKRVASLNDGSNINSVIVSGRRLSDQAGNDIVTWNAQSSGFGINTNSFYGFLKTDNLTGAKTYQFQNRNGVIADDTDLALKQASLVSGTNIKTVNGSSILGSGNLSVTTTFANQSEVNAGAVSNKAIAPDTNKIFAKKTAKKAALKYS